MAHAQLTKELTPALTGVRLDDRYSVIWECFTKLDSEGITALERSAIEAGFACTADQVADVVPVLHDANVAKVATAEFRDGVFTRLVNAPEVTAAAMPILFHTLYRLARECGRDKNVFAEPEFVLSFCVRALNVVARCDSGDAPCRTVWWTFHMLWAATAPSCTDQPWSVALAQAARDTFFIPAVACFARQRVADGPGSTSRNETCATAMQCLENITGMSPEIAALFCTAEFRDRYFITLFLTGGFHRNGSCYYSFPADTSNALLQIVSAVPPAQRQDVFATPAFRDIVMAQLVWAAAGTHDAVLETCEKVFIAIAENEDGTLHPTFEDKSFKEEVLQLLRQRQGCAIKSTW